MTPTADPRATRHGPSASGRHASRTIRTLVLLLAATATAPPAGLAQEARHGCFPARPLPDCRSSVIFEGWVRNPLWQTTRSFRFQTSGREGPVESTHSERHFDSSFGWDVGILWNLDERLSVGATVGIEGGHQNARYRIAPRARWEPAELDVALELAPALVMDRDIGGFGAPTYGGSLDARLVLANVGIVSLRYDDLAAARGPLPSDPGGRQRGISVGFGLAGQPAVWATVATGLGLAALFGLFVPLT